ncbi:hypothetical protein A8B78_12685 [Jannaschia sp. EhC01]|nr:hypothetical protein A8B78_12685 [Jannaschia sp. EhC01]
MSGRAANTAAAPTLDFERTARRDYRMWLAAIAGLLMAALAIGTLTDTRVMAIDDAPLWMSLIFLIAGAAMGGAATFALIANTSRGCRVDLDAGTLIWWQLRLAGQSLAQKHSIAISDIDRILVDQSGDGLSLKLYDTSGGVRDSFGEHCLPPDYDTWIATLTDLFPTIRVERR